VMVEDGVNEEISEGWGRNIYFVPNNSQNESVLEFSRTLKNFCLDRWSRSSFERRCRFVRRSNFPDTPPKVWAQLEVFSYRKYVNHLMGIVVCWFS
jgi:hypothetical protein